MRADLAYKIDLAFIPEESILELESSSNSISGI
jgi:hypothetical protein